MRRRASGSGEATPAAADTPVAEGIPGAAIRAALVTPAGSEFPVELALACQAGGQDAVGGVRRAGRLMGLHR
jgi:hypothetical protein